MSLEEAVDRANAAGWTVTFSARRWIVVSRGHGASIVRHQRRVPVGASLGKELDRLIAWLADEES